MEEGNGKRWKRVMGEVEVKVMEEVEEGNGGGRS